MLQVLMTLDNYRKLRDIFIHDLTVFLSLKKSFVLYD